MVARQFLAPSLLVLAGLWASPSKGEEFLPPDNYPPSTHSGPHGNLPTTDAMMMNPPHLVLQSPRRVAHPHPHSESASIVYQESSPAEFSPHGVPTAVVHVHEKISRHLVHADKMPRPPAIPEANRLPVWKTPYSYGHFGASRNRQWSLHHGYQQTYTQWTLR